MIPTIFLLSAVMVCAGLWQLIIEDDEAPATVTLLSSEDAAVAAAYVEATRKRENIALRINRNSQVIMWDEVNYPAAVWIWRGDFMGIPRDKGAA